MSDLSDHFRTALTMAHMLRTLPDEYEQRVYELVARTPSAKAYLDAGVALVVIEALIERDKLTGDNVEDVALLQRTYGAGLLAGIFRGDEPYRVPTVAAPRVPRVTIAERREKRRIRRAK